MSEESENIFCLKNKHYWRGPFWPEHQSYFLQTHRCGIEINGVGLKSEKFYSRILAHALIRIEALTELRRKFREWLPNEKRQKYYENTIARAIQMRGRWLYNYFLSGLLKK